MTQPIGIGAAVTVFVNSVLAMLVILNIVSLDSMQVAAVNLVVVNGVTLGAALYSWMNSTPTAAPTLKTGTQVKITDSTGTRVGTTTVTSDK